MSTEKIEVTLTAAPQPPTPEPPDCSKYQDAIAVALEWLKAKPRDRTMSKKELIAYLEGIE